MGTTAEKLTYLNDTKGSLKQSINNLGGSITGSTAFRQYATELDSIYSKLPKVTETGSVLSLTPTIKGRLSSIPKGDTFQQSYSGKNLLPFTNQDFTLKNVRYYVQNGSLYLNGTSTGETGVNSTEFKENFSFTLPAGTYYFNRGKNGNSLSLPSYIRTYEDNTSLATNWGSFTLEEETQVFLGFYVYQKTFSNNLIDIQLESGSSATSYEPYVGGTASPNPDYPQEIKSVTGLQKVSVGGKNLFDINNLNPYVYQASYTINNNQIQITSTATSGVSYSVLNPKITFKPNTTYTVSFDYTGDLNKILMFSDNYTVFGNQSTTNRLTFTTDNTNYELSLGIYPTIGNSVTCSNIQIEEGSTATEYEPYQNQEYEINLGKNLFDKSTAIVGKNWNGDNLVNSIASDYIEVEEGKSYIISVSNMSEYVSTTVVKFDSNKQVMLPAITTNPFTIPTGTKYIKLSIRSATNHTWTQEELDNAKYQIEVGSQATSYSPYFTPIHLYENDQIIGKPDNWSIKHVMGEVVLDGTGNYWVKGSLSNEQYTVFSAGFLLGYFKNSVISDKFTYANNLSVQSLTQESIYLGAATNYPIRISILNSRLSALTEAGFNQYLSNNPVKVVGTLVTPTTEPITDTDLIEDLNNFYNAKSYNGQTNISVEGDLPMILSVSALKGE